jgi:hypothetical protein
MAAEAPIPTPAVPRRFPIRTLRTAATVASWMKWLDDFADNYPYKFAAAWHVRGMQPGILCTKIDRAGQRRRRVAFHP